MNRTRKFPPFLDQTVTEWLSGHSERVYARMGNFTYSLALEGASLVRIARYDDPVRIPDFRFKISLSPAVSLNAHMRRWAGVFSPKTEIAWDGAVLEMGVAA